MVCVDCVQKSTAKFFGHKEQIELATEGHIYDNAVRLARRSLSTSTEVGVDNYEEENPGDIYT